MNRLIPMALATECFGCAIADIRGGWQRRSRTAHFRGLRRLSLSQVQSEYDRTELGGAVGSESRKPVELHAVLVCREVLGRGLERKDTR